MKLNEYTHPLTREDHKEFLEDFWTRCKVVRTYYFSKGFVELLTKQ